MSRASAIINIHREGLMLTPTLNSLRLAKQNAQQAGHEVELLIIADNSDDATLAIVERFSDTVDRVIPVRFADLGASREYGIAQAANDWVFMHDADDLFSSNWFLKFFEMQERGEIDDRTVYHTALFSRFGIEIDLRQMIDSWDPRFHPLFLSAEWYYSNKAVLNRKLFDEFPMPYNDKRIGIGNEDWTWSCHTINQGIRHSFLPETICFYRTKSVETSMGLIPGMIHDASPLFDPDSIIRLEIERAGRNDKAKGYVGAMIKKGEPVIGEGPPPDWFWSEVEIQGVFESLISDYKAIPYGELRSLFPNLNYNVASATHYLMRDMDERPKIFIFSTMENLLAADNTVELFLQAARDYQGQSHQPVLVVDEGAHVISDIAMMGSFGAKVICCDHFTSYYKPDEWYHNRVLMRPLVQYKGSIVLDLGSRTFAALFAEFHRVILENSASVSAVLTECAIDAMSPALGNIARNRAFSIAHNGKELRVLARAPVAESLNNSAGWDVAAWPDSVAGAVDEISKKRFRSIAGEASFDLAELLSAPVLPAKTGPASGHRISNSVTVEVRAKGGVSFSVLRQGRTKFYLYQTRTSWVAPDWYREAHRFLQGNKHIWIVPPQISTTRLVSGEYVSRWNAYTDPQLVFSAWYDQAMAGEDVPIAVLTREPLCADPPDTAANLARALYQYCADDKKLVSACNETVAIAMDAGGVDQ